MEPLRQQAADGQLDQQPDVNILDTPIYKQLFQLDQRIKQEIEALEELRGKNIILVIGNTGAGKSTLVNSIISGQETIEEDEVGDLVALKELTYKGRPIFQINHGALSMSQTPSFIPLGACEGEEIYIVDCPAMFDQDPCTEYRN